MIDPEFQRLLDERAIYECTVRYTFCLDARDWDGVAACFAPDAWIDYQDLPPGRPSAFLPVLRATIEQFALTQHFLTAQLVDWTGERIVAKSYALAYHRLVIDGQPAVDLVAGVHYLDSVEQRAKRWLITSRQVTTPWLRQDPVHSAAPMVPDGLS